MTMPWDEPQRTAKKKRHTRRDEIFEFICQYADELNGPTPSIREVSRHFGLNYKTAYFHVTRLILEGRLAWDRNKIIVERSEWIPPDFPESLR